MSQNGAHGAALSGLSLPQVLGFYYPGTGAGTIPDRSITVLLSGDLALTGAPSSSLEVHPAPGLTVTEAGTGRTAVLPSTGDRWRVVPRGAGLGLQQRAAGAWTDWSSAQWPPVTGPVQVSSADATLRRGYPGDGWRDYRGVLAAAPDGAGGLRVLSVVALEDYLRAVVPGEMPMSARLTGVQNAVALQAQAVAARSYADLKRTEARARSQGYDLCDWPRCQAYPGLRVQLPGRAATPVETAAASAAVTATSGQVRTYGGRTALTEYSASNGGWIVGSALGYQVAKSDPYDGLTGSVSHTWTATLTPEDLERAFPAVGRLTRLRVVERTGSGEWGGRVVSTVLEGVEAGGRPTSVTVPAAALVAAKSWPAQAAGLRSVWFRVLADATAAPVPPVAPAAPVSSRVPIGRLDDAAGRDGGVSLHGWALDPDTGSPVAAHVYVDGRGAAVLSADGHRPDVGAAFPAYGSAHGFATGVFVPPGPHQVCAYAIDAAPAGSSPAGNPLLGCRSVSVPGSVDPFGRLDEAVASSGRVRIRGWALDRSDPTALDVHVYLDGRGAGALRADSSRTDVGRAFAWGGDGHGFDASLPVAPGQHRLCAYGINVGAGTNQLLGCRDVTVT